MDIWKHGKYVDLWSVVHFLSGFLLGGIFYWLGASVGWAIGFSLLILFLWEIFEWATGIIEPSVNVAWDIITGLAGLLLAVEIYFWLGFAFSSPLFVTVLIVCLVLALWGFIDFLKRGYH